MTDIIEELEQYAKLAMPHYPNDLCSRAKREIERIQAAKRRALKVADERAKEIVELRAGVEQGWEYEAKPDGGDCRKIVTLDQDGMCWVGIRAFNATTGQWLNGGEPERAMVIAWRDLNEPAKGRWINGKLVWGRREFLLSEIAPGFTLKECGCREGLCDGLTDGTCRLT